MLFAGLLLLGAFLTASALAETGACGENLTWSLSDDGVLTVSGFGEMTDGDDYGTAPWDDVKASITEIVIEDGVRSVGAYMFWDCGGVSRVTLGDDVTHIGKAAFLYCEHLTELRLPPNIASVGDWAFIHCKALTAVYVPRSLDAFGDVVFWDCESLTDIYYEGSADEWGSVTGTEEPDAEDALYTATIHFGSTVQDYLDRVPETAGGTQQGTNPGEEDTGDPFGDDAAGGVVTRGKCGSGLYWLLNADGLLTISGSGGIDDYLRDIRYVYSASGSRTEVVTYTYPWFDVSNQIKRVYVSDGVTSIGNMAFAEISSLKAVYLPGSLTRVAYGAFHGTGLTDMYYADSAAQWAYVQRGDYNSPLNGASFHWDSEGLPEGEGGEDTAPLYLPADLTEIREEAFRGGTFTEVYLGGAVRAVGSRAFADCPNLWLVYFDTDDIVIAEDAFEGCGDLVFAAHEGSAAARYASAHGYSVSVVG